MLRIAQILVLSTVLNVPLAAQRPTLRELGVEVGVLPPGPENAIVDVRGVAVGHATVVAGDSINTGITVILPHADNIYQRPVPAAIAVGNGFGKLMGVTQVRELGELESPIALTCTLCVPRVADALIGYLLRQPGNDSVRSVNVVVGETNDGFLNDIRARAVTESDVLAAIAAASTEHVAQGSVGAGRGTRAFGWKGGIGTASRILPPELGGWTVGVLVQSNFGGILQIDGVPVGRELGRYFMREVVAADSTADGSIMIVVATDAPLASRNLERLASRALAGLARTGSAMTNGSGDYVIAFSTIPVDVIEAAGDLVPNQRMSPLFLAAIESTEEAIYNSLFTATTVVGHRGTTEQLPVAEVLEIMHRNGRL